MLHGFELECFGHCREILVGIARFKEDIDEKAACIQVAGCINHFMICILNTGDFYRLDMNGSLCLMSG